MDKINTPGHSGGKTNTIVGAVNIVVHGFGNSHRRETFFVETLPVTEGVISANGNQYINAQVLQVAEDMRGKIVEFVLFCLPFKEFRYVLLFGVLWICSRGGEMGASGTIYGANPCSVQFYNIFLSTLGVVGVELEPPFDDLHALSIGGGGPRLPAESRVALMRNLERPAPIRPALGGLVEQPSSGRPPAR